MNFIEIVAVAAPEYKGQPETRQCPDQYVGQICQLIGKVDFPLRMAVTNRPTSPCLIMVLESPHTDEFIGALGPAKGRTGELIRQYLPEALDLTSRQNFGLLLMNPIQQQCSLGEAPGRYRDQVFRAVWANGGQEDFSARLNSTFKYGDILMNCCTGSNDANTRPPLRSMVEKSIRETLPKVNAMRRTHPASWKDEKWRGWEWRF